MERNKPSTAHRERSGSTPAAVPFQRRKDLQGSIPFSVRTSVILPFVSFITLITFSIFLASCSSSVPIVKKTTPSAKKIPPQVITAKPLLPEGWADITSRSKLPQIKQWIVNRNYSATMVLRELQTDSATFRDLEKEEMNLVAGISLRGKVRQDDADYRVTRVPELFDGKRNFSSYAYTERGLLRRVVVFRKQNRFLELELMQEQTGAPFDELTNDLIAFAVMIHER